MRSVAWAGSQGPPVSSAAVTTPSRRVAVALIAIPVALAAAWWVPLVAVAVVWPLFLLVPGVGDGGGAPPADRRRGRIGLAIVGSVAVPPISCTGSATWSAAMGGRRVRRRGRPGAPDLSPRGAATAHRRGVRRSHGLGARRRGPLRRWWGSRSAVGCGEKRDAGVAAGRLQLERPRRSPVDRRRVSTRATFRRRCRISRARR